MTTTALRPRTPTEIVDAAFQILRAHYGTYVMCSALAYLPLLVVRFVLVGDPERFLNGSARVDASLGWIYLVSAVIGLVTYAVISAVLAVCTSRIYLGEALDVAEAVRTVVPKLPAVFVAALLRYLLIFLGFFALLVGALWVAARCFSVTTVQVLENASIGQAFSRSRVLSDGRKRHILNTLGLAVLIYWVLVLGTTMLAAVSGNFLIQSLVSGVVTILVYPVVAITETLLYYDTRIQSEGLDIELMTAALEPAPAPAP